MIASTRIDGILGPGICLADGEYQITKPLGQGGFGITYRGTDTRLNRPVAIKEFFPEGCWREGSSVVSAGKWNLTTYRSAKQKFLQEGRTLGQFNHTGIVKVFHYFEENNTAYMVMEYLQGKTLTEKLKERGGRLKEAEALYYIAKIGQALEVLHQARFLHRDIKPSNIMLADDERVVLIDFGAARDFTSHNFKKFTAMVTPGYAPLEQYGRALQHGSFTDVYALGATLYHLLTGSVPISAVERAAGVELKEARQLNSQISPHVSQAISKAMVMNIEQRSQSVREFLELLDRDLCQPLPKTKTPKIHFYHSVRDPWSAFATSTIASTPGIKTTRNSEDRWF
ncbi:serine/threonine-protein kinase [Myxosarcina sp. GI1]|uniref:serine/threonine protein kinase n=1 Tax=Myxosarcina sp. GI1 TaxID=1541065 RepID=UPI00056B8544|nr:serine/threonine-protein kinase [Myxosarcina sp. GI1]